MKHGKGKIPKKEMAFLLSYFFFVRRFFAFASKDEYLQLCIKVIKFYEGRIYDGKYEILNGKNCGLVNK